MFVGFGGMLLSFRVIPGPVLLGGGAVRLGGFLVVLGCFAVRFFGHTNILLVDGLDQSRFALRKPVGFLIRPGEASQKCSRLTTV